MAKRKNKRLLPNGRNSGMGNFIALPHYVFDCSAYREMKPGPRALLDELIRRYNGSNNGQIGLGHREAAKCLNVNKDTVGGYFEELEKRGFIASARPGGFNMKDPAGRRATEWRLTWHSTHSMLATKEFKSFAEKTAVPIIRTAGTENPDATTMQTWLRTENPDVPGT